MAKGIYVYQQIIETPTEWESNESIYPNGVFLFEDLGNGKFNIALSDGVHRFVDLPKAFMNALVTVKTNTETEYVLTITSPEGSFDTPNLKGPKGDQGIQGIQGDKGDKGDQGEQGIQGIQGIQGEKGDTGEKGDKGDKGDIGTVGIMLDAEPTEDTLTYIVGGVTYNFELGMSAICQDPSADNGRSVYLFKGKTDEGKAIWWKTGSNYQHPSHTAHESGLYKITTDGLGHVSNATSVTKADITALGIPAQNTTYSAGSGLSLSGTTINHASSITAGTAGSSSSTSGSSTISIPYVTYNATGHITGKGNRTHTINAATTSASGLMSSTDKTKMNRLESYTTATTVASLDVNYQTIYVTLSANASLSANSTGSAYNGRSITAYVYTSSSVTITIPTSGDYVSMCGSSFTTTAGGWVEFSLVCVNGIWHIAKLEAE